MSRFRSRLRRDLGHIGDRAAPSSDAWRSIRERIDDHGDDRLEDIVTLKTERDDGQSRSTLPIASAAAAIVVAAIVAALLLIDDGGDDDVAVADETPAPAIEGAGAEEAGDDGEKIRIDTCTIEDGVLVLTGASTATRQASYHLFVVNDDGQQSHPVFVNGLRPGERFVHRDGDPRWAELRTCDDAVVAARGTDRFSENADQASCDVTGRDSQGSLTVDVTATNEGDEVADLVVLAAVVADGVRLGTASAFFDSLAPDASATASVASTAEDLEGEVTCEPLHVRPMS